MDTRMVDQVHIVDTGRTGRRAGKAGQTAIDMRHHLGIGWPTVFQHVLDEVNASTRTVEFVAERHIGRTGGGAEAAMHAFAQDRLGFGHMRVGKLFGREIGLHLPMSPFEQDRAPHLAYRPPSPRFDGEKGIGASSVTSQPLSSR